MKKILKWFSSLRESRKIMIIGFIIWFIPTAIFGFQAKPSNWFESLTDYMGGVIMFWGLLKDIFSEITIQNFISIDKKMIEDLFKK